jgi:hypothetical protein
MKHAFKEWAVVVDALLHGQQMIILRKGGLVEGSGGFEVEQKEFLLFPTLFHQQRESVMPPAQARYDQIIDHLPDPAVVRLEGFARVVESRRLESLTAAHALRDMHIWRDDVIEKRFDWSHDKLIHVLAVRVFRLPAPVELPMRESYGGCRSWIELAEDISPLNAQAVLEENTFAAQLQRFHRALESVAKPAPAN